MNRDDHLFRGVLLSGADSSFLPACTHSEKLFFSEPSPSEPFRLGRKTQTYLYMRVRPTDAGCSFCVIAARRIFIALREVIRMENKKIFIMLYLRQSTKCDTVRLIWSKSATLTLISLGKKWPPSKINLARTQQNNDHLLGRQLINNEFVSALYYLWQKTLNSISVVFSLHLRTRATKWFQYFN